MNSTSIIPLLALILVALGVARLVDRLRPRPSDFGRVHTIDGLRGWLAYFVFIHHASVWFFYLRVDRWDVPPSRLYTHLGESSVALFFMITGFLFSGKLLRAKSSGLDWLHLFVSRIMRLTPLYLVSVGLMLMIVTWMTNGQWNVNPMRAIRAAFEWLLFSIPGSPAVNGLSNTFSIMAGVTWSLRYEWLFYLFLPMLALAFGAPMERRWIAVSIAGCTLMLHFWKPELIRLVPFISGAGAAVLSLSPAFNRFAAHRAVSVAVVALVTIAVLAFPTVYQPEPILLLTIAFSLVANGNDLFGLLRARASLLIGDLSYGVYLVHGIILYILFEIVLGRPLATSLSVAAHWSLIILASPLILGFAYLAFHWIERPCMNATASALHMVSSYERKNRSYGGRS